MSKQHKANRKSPTKKQTNYERYGNKPAGHPEGGRGFDHKDVEQVFQDGILGPECHGGRFGHTLGG
jgi:hypothetical protein